MANVQFNLLPDIKMTHVKTQRTSNLVVTIALLVSAGAFALFVILFVTVNLVQKKLLSDADADIKRLTSELQSKPGISEQLTAQNQLKSLTALHQSKHIASRIFTYLPQVTPARVGIGQVSLDFSAGKLAIDGTADSQLDVNKFVDTLKFTTFSVGNGGASNRAFSKVVQTSFTINEPDQISYTLTIDFDPNLFANNLLDNDGKPQTPVLAVPKLTTTHAQNGDGSALFNESQEQ